MAGRFVRKWLNKPVYLLCAIAACMLLSACNGVSQSPATPTPAGLTVAVTAAPTPAPTVEVTPVKPSPAAPGAPSPVQTSIRVASPPAVEPPLTVSSLNLEVTLAGVPAHLYIPSGLPGNKPAQFLVVLHGMKSNGLSMSQGLFNFAEQYKWILIAPTFNYSSEWQNPQVIAQEEPVLAGRINEMLSATIEYTGLPVSNRILLYGFSRGAQLAHRYALMYPERTLAVTTTSAGSYTLPYVNVDQLASSRPARNELLTFPFGVANLDLYTGHSFNKTAFQKISFRVEVGELDNREGEAPPAFNPYLGTTRLERARTFYAGLKQMGLNTTLMIYPNVGHEITPEMRSQACKFFRAMVQQSSAS